MIPGRNTGSHAHPEPDLALKLAALVDTSRSVAATRSRRDKIALLAELFARVPPDEIELAASYLCGVVRQEKLGLGWAGLQAADAVAAPGTGLFDADAEPLGGRRRARGAGRDPRAHRPHHRQGLGRRAAAAPARTARAARRRRAAVSVRPRDGRAPPGRARRAGDRGGGSRGRPPGGRRAPCRHADGRPAARRPRGADRGSRGARALRRAALPAGAADAGRQRGQRGRGARRAGRGGARVEARRRPGPGPQGGRRDPGLFSPAQRGHARRCPRSSTPCARCPRAS